MLYSVYHALTSVSSPALNLLLQKRLENNKEDPVRIGERRGEATLARPDGRLMWFHGASVGESLSILPLLNTLKARLPDWHFMVTTGTVTSANIMAQRLPEGVIHQFIPMDHPKWVRKFMAHWRPDAVVWLESELWPNTLNQIKQKNIPAVLINARMRPKTYAKWKYARGFVGGMLSAFDLTLTGAREFVGLFKDLGAKNVHYVGSLKFGAKALPVDPEKLAALKQMIGSRPCIGFLSTHPGEEKIFAHVVKELKQIKPDILGIIAPRKHTRGLEIRDDLGDCKVAVRTQNDTITPDTEIYVADTIGEMGLWYSLCPIAVIGGSFIYYGGQNPIEGTHFGTAVLYGPSMFNFPELCVVLEEGGAAKQMTTPEELLTTIRDLYAHPEKLEQMKMASFSLAEQNHSVIDAFADEIIATCAGAA